MLEYNGLPNDYRQILKDELDQRCSQNSRYSLRAFARDLGIAPSRLSEILNKKQGLSRKGAEKIAGHLGFMPDESEYFCDLVASEHARSKSERQYAQVRLKKYETEHDAVYQLQVDAFKVIADWYHLAIIELTKLEAFKFDARWIARRLRITPIQVELAVERLERLGLVEVVGDRLVVKEDEGSVPGGVPSDSIKKFHRQIMSRALEALTGQSVQKRDFSAQMVTIDKNELPYAKKAIENFQHRFCSNLNKAKKKDSLYCLAIQFFDLLEE